MNTPHKHADCIKAWADGAEIEFYDTTVQKWRKAPAPAWSPSVMYRIVPKKIIGYIDPLQMGHKTNPYAVLRMHPQGSCNVKVEITYLTDE